MAIINKVENVASITYNGNTINSLPSETLLLVLPTIINTADKAITDIGDIVTYTITIANLGLTSITNLPFSDVIPEGCEYEEDSFKLNGSTVAPTFEDDTLSYIIPSVSPLGTVSIEFQVLVIGGEN